MASGGSPNANGIPGGRGTPNGQRLSPDDAAQFSREAQQRLADAEALRRDLQRQGLPTAELDRAIEGLRQLTDPRSLESASTTLRSQVVDGLKEFEFGLRRRLGEDDAAKVLLERSGDVPPEYRQNVEEYYRSIGKGKPTPKP